MCTMQKIIIFSLSCLIATEFEEKLEERVTNPQLQTLIGTLKVVFKTCVYMFHQSSHHICHRNLIDYYI